LEDPGVDGRIILKMDLQEVVRGHGMDWSGSGYGHVAGSYKYGNEPSGSTKRGKFLDYLRTC